LYPAKGGCEQKMIAFGHRLIRKRSRRPAYSGRGFLLSRRFVFPERRSVAGEVEKSLRGDAEPVALAAAGLQLVSTG
jgi:hypothetical protein